MFERKALTYLKDWHQQKKRKPLILRGARQVGKSSLIEFFAKKNNLNLIEINFETTSLDSLKKNIIEVEQVLNDIELTIGRKIDFKKDLLFFDEIQKNPNALLSLRYFYEKKPELAIISAGSLLDFLLQDTEISFPVGRVEFIFLGPVSFSEFLAATKQNRLLEEFAKDLKKISQKAHQLLMEQYRLYCCVGGMPEAVQTYLDTKDLFAVRKIHRSILQTYKADFLKYSKKHEIFRCDKIFNYVPTHLGQKIKYSEIDSSEKSRDLKKALSTLLYARVLLASYHTNATAVPLRAFMDESVLKLYFLDIGLALTQTEEDFKNILQEESILSGSAAEQFVNQHMASIHLQNEPELFYWLKDKSASKAEIDLIYSKEQQIVPIEVKANKSLKYKSLHVFMSEKQKIKNAIIISGQNYEKKNILTKIKTSHSVQQVEYTLYNIPLWAIEKIDEVADYFTFSKVK